MKNFNIKSKKGFTLIELLVVIGILAVLAAIAIPSVAGLIDRANVSSDQTNANEMTNAVERFASEYELYVQDIGSGALNPNDLDSAQGRVYNVTGATTRGDITAIEKAQSVKVADVGDEVAIYRDTKYPVNNATLQKVVENYMKTSSSTFEPKQSDMHYWYSPDCGVVVVAEPEKTDIELDKYIVSGKDAKGNDISSDSVNAQWIDLTAEISNNDDNENLQNSALIHNGIIPVGGEYIRGFIPEIEGYGTLNCPNCSTWCSCNAEVFVAGDMFPSDVQVGDVYFYGDYGYLYGFSYDGYTCPFSLHSPKSSNYIDAVVTIDNSNISGWQVAISNSSAYNGKRYAQGDILKSINNVNVTNMNNTFTNCAYMETFPKIPETVTKFSFEASFMHPVVRPNGTLQMPCHLNPGISSYEVGSPDGGFTYMNIEVERYHYDGCGH